MDFMSVENILTFLPGFTEWIYKLLDILWLRIAEKIGGAASEVVRKIFADGVYEILDYESTLEIHDAKGTRATFSKTKKIRYLQNNVIAFQDYAWGDGDILLDYHTSRGRPVDLYRSGFKTYILLSLREVKNSGDLDEFNIQWNIRRGFLTPDGYWGADISQRTRHIKMNVIFPESRPPIHPSLEENIRQRTYTLDRGNQKQLADGRWLVTWETNQPKLLELYVLRWTW
jgi:hypothetical protein